MDNEKFEEIMNLMFINYTVSEDEKAAIHDTLFTINTFCEKAGGKLMSRQVIAQVIVAELFDGGKHDSSI